MMTYKELKVLLIAMLICNLGISQIKDGVIFHINGGSVVKGELMNSDSVFKVKLSSGSIFDIKKIEVTKVLLPEEINLYASGKFNYKKGLLLYIQSSNSNNHSGIGGFLGYSLGNGLELGLGLSFHNNSLSIPVSNTFQLIDVNSFPVFVSGKYFILPKYIRKPYVKLTLGYTNNSTGFSLNQVSGGPMFETGIGVALSSKKKTKFFLELLQYSSLIRGSIPNVNVNSISDVNFNIWFNKIVFNFGIYIGR